MVNSGVWRRESGPGPCRVRREHPRVGSDSDPPPGSAPDHLQRRRGSHGPTIDRPPLARLGGRPPGLRADPGQRPQGPGPPPPPCPGRGLRPLLSRSGPTTSRRARPGLAHFVEHMLFKGTERFPKGQIDRLAFVAAGQSNAETGEDSTHYWFAFPSDRWELALAIESDRMRGATFDPARGRGRAPGDRRGAGPRPGVARSPGSTSQHLVDQLRPPPLPEPDPGLARRPGTDRAWPTSSRSTATITGPTGRSW